MQKHRSQSVFKALDDQGAGAVAVSEILSRLTEAGLPSDDPRLAGLSERLTQGAQKRDGKIDAVGPARRCC